MFFISGPSSTPGTEQVHNEEKEQVNPFMIWPLICLYFWYPSCPNNVPATPNYFQVSK